MMLWNDRIICLMKTDATVMRDKQSERRWWIGQMVSVDRRLGIDPATFTPHIQLKWASVRLRDKPAGCSNLIVASYIKIVNNFLIGMQSPR